MKIVQKVIFYFRFKNDFIKEKNYLTQVFWRQLKPHMLFCYHQESILLRFSAVPNCSKNNTTLRTENTVTTKTTAAAAAITNTQ